MNQLVFFLEERSARTMLQVVLPKILPETIQLTYIVFRGKQDLEKRLLMRLRAWQNPRAKFVVLRDQDGADCKEIKDNLIAKCREAGKPDVLVRIACRELESFYLGDLDAIAASIGPDNLGRLKNRDKFRNPDKLMNPSNELKKLAPSYRKQSGSRAISAKLDLENNRSASFRALVSGVRKLIGVTSE